MSTSYNAFTAKLRKAGWSSIGQGTYQHEDGGKVNLWAGGPWGDETATELWRWFAAHDLMPPTDALTMWPPEEVQHDLA